MKAGDIVTPVTHTTNLYDVWENDQAIIGRVVFGSYSVVLDVIDDIEDDYVYPPRKYEVSKILCDAKVGWLRSSFLRSVS